jgi:hypothetical protein
MASRSDSALRTTGWMLRLAEVWDQPNTEAQRVLLSVHDELRTVDLEELRAMFGFLLAFTVGVLGVSAPEGRTLTDLVTDLHIEALMKAETQDPT